MIRVFTQEEIDTASSDGGQREAITRAFFLSLASLTQSGNSGYHDHRAAFQKSMHGAFVNMDGSATQHYKDGELHRIDGPAIERRDRSNEWWVNGQRIKFKEICQRHGLSLNYKKWTDADKVMFRLAV